MSGNQKQQKLLYLNQLNAKPFYDLTNELKYDWRSVGKYKFKIDSNKLV